MFDILSSEEIAAIVATNAPTTQLATKQLVDELRAKAMSTGQQQPIVYLQIGKEGAIALLGIRECKEGEIPQYTTGTKENRRKWTGDWNKGNRQIIDTNLAKIFKAMIGGRFVPTPETAIFLDDGQCGSAQHRLWTVFDICQSQPDFTATLAVSFGFSAKLADVLDRAAKRSKAAIAQRNNIIDDSDFQREVNVIDPTTGIATVTLENMVSDVSKAVATCNRELTQLLGILDKRATGRDVKASGEFDEASFGHMLQRCPDAAKLLVDLYIRGKGGDGKDIPLVSVFGRPMVGAMLILSANTDNPAEWEPSENGRSRVWTLPDTITTPTPEIVDGFLAVGGNGPNEPFYEVFKKLASKQFNRHAQRKAGLLNAMLRHFLATRELLTIPAPCDSTTGQPLPGAKEETRWVCPPAQFDSLDPGVPKTKGDDGQIPPPYKWYNFGGLDCGYLPPLGK